MFKEVIKKIMHAETNIKKRILDLYMARQNFLHTLRFLQWLVINRPEKYEGEAVSDHV